MRYLRKPFYLILTISLLILAGCWNFIDKEAMEKFESREGTFTVTVLPVSIVTGGTRVSDEELAASIAHFLNSEELAEAVYSTEPIDIPVKWGRNQAKMVQQSALAFSEEIKKREYQTDYVLLVEILSNASENRVGGVHYFLTDNKGNLADAMLANSHWEVFTKVDPKERKGGVEVAKLMLKTEWSEPVAE